MLDDAMDSLSTELGGSFSGIGKAVESGKVGTTMQLGGTAPCVHILLYFSSERIPEYLPIIFKYYKKLIKIKYFKFLKNEISFLYKPHLTSLPP